MRDPFLKKIIWSEESQMRGKCSPQIKWIVILSFIFLVQTVRMELPLKKKSEYISCTSPKKGNWSIWMAQFVPPPSPTHRGITVAFKNNKTLKPLGKKRNFGKKSKCCYLFRIFLPEMLDFNSQIITLPSLTMRAAAFSFTGQHTMLKGRTVLVTLMASHWLLKS